MSHADHAAHATSALRGVRVADFSRVLAGPFATMMLADLGADVIKIESPAGDDTRGWIPPADSAGRGTYFASVNRNKRSIALDLASDEGRQRAWQLASTADVVVENFRPGTMQKFGLDHGRLLAANPRVVMCSITGFGSGAGADLPGYDLLVQAMGGLMSITGDPDGEPTKAGVALVDVITGLNAVIGIQAALRHADATGRGQHVEVNLLSSLLAALTNQASAAISTGRSPARLGNRHPSITPYETFHAADASLAVAVGNDRQFASFAGVLGMPELADDARFATNQARVGNRDALRSLIEPALAQRPADHWVMALTEARVPAGRVNTVLEGFELAERLGLAPIVEIDDPDAGAPGRQVASALRLSATPPVYRSAPPALGAHDGAWWHDAASEPAPASEPPASAAASSAHLDLANQHPHRPESERHDDR
ncbi:CaiB/BaiF CoA transferase family protein [Ruicaihuangia caeni]|uniref:CoA transferase n=1 Tax=Ruicaihuangia caeni TaxID=3042517 RepID=A0AAW6T9U1_9MICO|nr:CoA transferase [Klugiella sp. YN-L-19]MDI2098397.1 CoA transferase [Klugiella sp. YN-L-19]